MYNDILDDPKIAQMSAKTFKTFTFLLAFCSSLENNGIIFVTKDDPIWRLRMRKNDWNIAIKELIKLDVISMQGDVINILNWNKRQFISDDINERVKRYRGKKETLHETLHETPPDTDTETETEQIQNIPENGKEFSEDVIYLSNLFFTTLTDDLKKELAANKKKQLSWLDAFDKLIKIDKYTKDELKNIVLYFRGNDFWSKQFLSQLKLRRNNPDGVKYARFFKEFLKTSIERTGNASNTNSEEFKRSEIYETFFGNRSSVEQ